MIVRDALDAVFPRYRTFDPAVPVWCVTDDHEGVIHRFYETWPVSPSGRYLAGTRLPSETTLPSPGDAADVVCVDLRTGEQSVVASTRAWDTQVGAQVRWGGDDLTLLFNDLDMGAWTPFGVAIDPETGDRQRLDGTVYTASPGGDRVASPDLRRIRRTLHGYGAVVPDDARPENEGAPDDDGVFITDVASGRTELVASLATIVAAVDVDGREYGPGGFYCFHVMWSPDGSRLLCILFYAVDGDEGYTTKQVVTLAPDGTDIRLAVPWSDWRRGGHHPRWTPDGDVSMNLALNGGPLRFVTVPQDGSGPPSALCDTIEGSGHPSLHPNGRTLLADSYLWESPAYGDGTVPLRLVDVAAETEREVVRIRTEPSVTGPNNELRVDPHPAWGPSHRWVAFNGFANGTRQVFLADFAPVLDDETSAT